jgi:GntR family transcriptional regulator
MRGALKVNTSDAVPIWRQIEEGVRRLVASGTLDPGDPVLSVRELARELRVNPATVAKAYQRLTDAGLLRVRRGEGTFVAERSPEEMSRERYQLLSHEADRYVTVARTIRATRQEAFAAVDQAWAAWQRSDRPGRDMPTHPDRDLSSGEEQGGAGE